jgi:hypothetical protein
VPYTPAIAHLRRSNCSFGEKAEVSSALTALEISQKNSMIIGPHSDIDDSTTDGAVAVAVIDGPYDAVALSSVLAHAPMSLGDGACGADPNNACEHGTFIMGLLGAHSDAAIPGLCPDCRLLHIPLFIDEYSPSASVDELAAAIRKAVAAGARLINLSLAILGDDLENHPGLAAALDFAELNGAIVVAAAGNQGRLAMGQLLSHPVVVPVVGADASQRMMPEDNFGPAISQRGIAALGRMAGYAPGGAITVMSGTSVATAVATGTLAQLWSAHPEVDSIKLRAIVAGLGPRNGSTPPMLSRGFIMESLDQTASAVAAAARHAPDEMTNYASLQGGRTMVMGNGQPAPPRGASTVAKPAQTLVPAGGAGGCACGAPDGVCTCDGGQADLSGFVYAIGTIEAECPNVAIEREMQALAHDMAIAVPASDPPIKPTEDREWQHAVLSGDGKSDRKSKEKKSEDRKRARYIARQLIWYLSIEGTKRFVLKVRDPSDLDELIDCLARPKYPPPERRGGRRAAKSPAIEPPFADDRDVAIGVLGSDDIAVLVDQIFTISPSQRAPEGIPYFSQLSDDYGLTDRDRAYNFLTARYQPPPSQGEGLEFHGMYVVPSRLSPGVGRIVRGIYTFRNKTTGVERKFFVRVDVTHEFPFIVTPWQPYLDRGEGS